MRYNADIQTQADKLAQEHGFFCAVYLGPTDDSLIFVPRYADNEPRCTGLAFYIIYHEGELTIEQGLNFGKYLKELRYRYYPQKGKELFDAYKQIYNLIVKYIFERDDEAEFITELIAASTGGGYDIPVELRDIYEALEIAQRMDMTIEFYPDPSTTDRNDGWEFFIRIVEGKLPDPQSLIVD